MKQARRRTAKSLTGLSVGDAFGQTFFVSEDEARARVGQRELARGPWAFTDDTLMGVSVVDVLEAHGKIEQDALAASLAAGYDMSRGYGPSMHRLLARVRDGEDWRVASAEQFDGQGSLGNGAAMRAGPIGAYFADDLEQVGEQAALSAVVTHAHAEGVAGAIAVALAAAWACRAGRGEGLSLEAFLEKVADGMPESRVREGILTAMRLGRQASVRLAVSALGNGTKLSAPDTVPFALWCAGKHLGDYEEALWETVAGLGDRDTTCAIVGSVVACTAEVPGEWLALREALAGA